MKKYLFMIAATCVVLACSKENIQSDATPDNEQSGVSIEGDKISFVVDVESTSDVKATISSNTNFTWESTDRAAVYTSDGSYKVELTPTVIDGCKAEFTGTVPSGKTVADGAIVVYPYEFLSGPSTVTFPAEYTSNGQGTVLAAKVASGRKLTFKYLAATLKATITDVPSIATTITVTSSETLTGEHTINFTGDTPALYTSSTAKTITFSSLAKGNTVLVVPVPTAGTQTFTYNVNYSSGILFTKSTEQTLSRKSYMSMKDVAIAPEVYLSSSMTGWSTTYGAMAAPMAKDGNTYSLTVQSLGSQMAKVNVVYPYNSTVIEMGPEEGHSSDYDDVEYTKGSVYTTSLSERGTYSFSFNVATGHMNVSYNPTFNLYLSRESASWAYDNAISLEEIGGAGSNKFLYIGDFQHGIKAYYNHYPCSRIVATEQGNSGSLQRETEASAGASMYVDDNNSYLAFIDIANYTFLINYLTSTSDASNTASDNIYFKTLTNDLGYTMTKTLGNAHLWQYDWTVPNYNNWDGDALNFWVDYKDGGSGVDFELKPDNATVISSTPGPTYTNRDSKTDQWWFNKDQFVRILVNDTNSNVFFLKLD